MRIGLWATRPLFTGPRHRMSQIDHALTVSGAGLHNPASHVPHSSDSPMGAISTKEKRNAQEKEIWKTKKK